MNYTTLKTKYIVGICCLLLAVVVLLLAYMYRQFAAQIESELFKRGASIASNLAAQAVTPILTENRIALQLLIREAKANETDIRYIYLVDPEGKVIAHSFDHPFPPDLLKMAVSETVAERQCVRSIRTEEGEIIDVNVPVHGGEFGWMHVGLSEMFIGQELAHILLKGVPIIALILLAGTGGAWWFAVRITRPLAQLSASVAQVAAGKLDGEIEEVTNDEVGELSHAHNVMVRKLRELTAEQEKTEQELRLQATMLEQEVAERQETQQQLAYKQQQLESLNRALEERVAKAVHELRLKDKMMMLQGRQAAMGEMINSIAHQWRQPINNLGLIVQGMKLDYDSNELTPAQMDEDVDKIMQTIMFMSQTINDFSRFFSVDRTRTRFNPAEGLKKVVTMMEATLFAQNVSLIVEGQEEVLIEGFSNEYNQVLLNLLNNARDVLIERGVAKPAIRVVIGQEEGNAVVRVQDNAGGISKEIIGKVFDPYFTTKEDGKGSGIGLYLSRMIIQEHFGGSLTVRNIGSGAEFCIRTPCA